MEEAHLAEGGWGVAERGVVESREMEGEGWVGAD